jgi:hypothetical protein
MRKGDTYTYAKNTKAYLCVTNTLRTLFFIDDIEEQNILIDVLLLELLLLTFSRKTKKQ